MDLNNIPNINILWATLIIEELVRNGVSDFFIAPGSRSAPLAIAAAQHKEAKKYVHFDERGLSFFALGKIAASKKPAALISTSGTAVANFFPAVIETSKKKLPLILLTADRPPELLNTGALQTIDQKQIYGKYTRWECEMPVPDPEIPAEMVLTTIDQAVFKAKYPEPGPVHINCAFREPLSLQEVAGEKPFYSRRMTQWIASVSPFTSYVMDGERAAYPMEEDILSKIQDKNGIIVVGKLGHDEERTAVLDVAKELNWPIFPDISSGLRVGFESDLLIPYYDKILGTTVLDRFDIDTVLHLGGRITSKSFYAYIKRKTPDNYITVLNHYLRNDPLHCVTDRIKSGILPFINSLLLQLKSNGSNPHLDYIRRCNRLIDQYYREFDAKQIKLSEISLARILSTHIPADNSLFLSNSMPIRDMDTFASSNGPALPIGANRGASGIDGIVASACGFSDGLERDLTAVIGDLSFLHDMNSLALTKSISNRTIFCVINNRGGGIFSFLPVNDDSELFEAYFGTPHEFNFKHVAEMFGLKYYNPVSNAELIKDYRHALQKDRPAIIEINTDRAQNLELHRKIDREIAELLRGDH